MFSQTELTIFSVIVFFTVLCLIVVLLIITQRKRKDEKHKKIYETRDYIFEKYYKGEYKNPLPFTKQFLLKEFYKIEDQVKFSPIIRKKILDDFTEKKLYIKYLKQLKSRSRIKRILAAHYLGIFENKMIFNKLEERLLIEKDESVKFYISYSLMKYIRKDSFLAVVNSLIGSSKSYQKKITTIINNNFNKNNTYLFNLEDREEIEIKILLLKISSEHINSFLKQYTITFFNNNKDKIMQANCSSVLESEMYKAALLAIIKIDETFIDKFKLITCSKLEIREIGAEYFSKSKSFDDVLLLLDSLEETKSIDLVVDIILKIISSDSLLVISLLKEYRKEEIEIRKDAIARVLSSRTNYILYKIIGEEEEMITDLVFHILRLGRTSSIIDFLNENISIEIERKLLKIVSTVMKENEEFLREIRMYLKEEILKKLFLSKLELKQTEREKPPFEVKKVIWMISILLLALLIYPTLFILKNYSILSTLSILEIFHKFVVDVNYNLIFYFLCLNSIYLTFIVISFIETKKQMDLWDIKSNTLLFENDLLPSISIIVPAYNEEVTIIESIKSLLNLKYPKYNVIVVNDGSKDKTLQVLTSFFELERRNPFYEKSIPTKNVRGVYQNRYISNLIVIDKENGGKADALNVGINFSKNDFICGIDADSLLEVESLLRVISVTLDFNEPHIAIGGNISPVNGCVIDHGKIESYGLGKQLIVKYQTLEYMRAFNTGRIGWTKLKSLLIISGAFGVFDKQKILEAGGYITSSGLYKKDSVGEDMELVVRLTHNALKNKEKFKVNYVYHALCYTELPSSADVLFKQRNRWHRGLVDILHYHRKMTFNYKYKQTGLIGMPYFLIFEMIGPFLESMGYLMLILGLVLGLLTPLLVAIIFSVSILFGIFLSLCALLVSERKDEYTNKKTTLTLIFFAIIENIGYRQIVSVHRIISFFSALKDSGKWGSQKRKGFVSKETII